MSGLLSEQRQESRQTFTVQIKPLDRRLTRFLPQIEIASTLGKCLNCAISNLFKIKKGNQDAIGSIDHFLDWRRLGTDHQAASAQCFNQ